MEGAGRCTATLVEGAAGSRSRSGIASGESRVNLAEDRLATTFANQPWAESQGSMVEPSGARVHADPMIPVGKSRLSTKGRSYFAG